MKKILAVVLTLVLVFALGTFASAAGTYGTYEQKVIEFLDKEYTFTEGGKTAKFIIPDDYINQAKAYFLKTEGDITEAQYNEIVKFVGEGKKLVSDAVHANPEVIKNGTVDIRLLSREVRKGVLQKGQEACAVVGLSLVFDGTHVVITDAAGNVAFKDAPVIKTTGADVNTVSVALCAAVILTLAGAAVVTAKKAELF